MSSDWSGLLCGATACREHDRIAAELEILVKDAVMRFPEAITHDPDIDVWLNSPPDELRSIARRWYALMRKCGNDVRELMHDGAPTACVGDAAFAYVNTFASHVNVGFFYGVALKDPAGLLEGTGKRMRHVKLRPGIEINSAALTALIRASYLDMKTRASGVTHAT